MSSLQPGFSVCVAGWSSPCLLEDCDHTTAITLSLHIRSNILFRLDTFHPSFSVSSSHSSFAFTVLSCSIFVAMGLALFRHWRVVGICQLALSVWVNCTVEPFIAVGLNAHWGSSWYDCFLMTERLSHRCKASLFFYNCSGQKLANNIKCCVLLDCLCNAYESHCLDFMKHPKCAYTVCLCFNSLSVRAVMLLTCCCFFLLKSNP